jgi:hypothetical protein
METVNERSTSFVTLTFRDESDALVIPSSGTCQIHDAASGTEIRAESPFTPAGSTHDITISDTENRILDATRNVEERIVTVTFTYGTGKKGSGEYRYGLKNLAKIS